MVSRCGGPNDSPEAVKTLFETFPDWWNCYTDTLRSATERFYDIILRYTTFYILTELAHFTISLLMCIVPKGGRTPPSREIQSAYRLYGGVWRIGGIFCLSRYYSQLRLCPNCILRRFHMGIWPKLIRCQKLDFIERRISKCAIPKISPFNVEFFSPS